MDIVVKIAQLILALSILVFIHELGHFLFARLFKIRVDKFYLFFDWGWRLFKFKPKNSDTEYGIGWLPLGGYCKIAGMVDESMDTESLKKEPQPWEFRSKPAWQRFLVIFGGVFFNILLAIAVYSAVLFTWGEEYVKNSDVTTGIAVNRLAYDMGFRDGDRILAFDGEYVEDFADLQISLIRNQAEYATVVRDGDTITVKIALGKTALSLYVALFRRLFPPISSRLQVFNSTFSIIITYPNVILCLRHTMFCGFFPPISRLNLILSNTITTEIRISK